LLAEAAEEGDGVAEHGVVGIRVLHGAIEFAFDAGYGLEEKLAEVAESVGRLVRDALFGERGEDFAEDVVYVRDSVELAGKGGELGSELVGFEKLLLFAGVEDAEGRMAFFADHATGAAVGELAKTLIAVCVEGIGFHWKPQERKDLSAETRRAQRRSENGNFQECSSRPDIILQVVMLSQRVCSCQANFVSN